MNTVRLFRITQASVTAIGYVLDGLRARWANKGDKVLGVTLLPSSFDSEFDSKTGDYYVILKTDDAVQADSLERIVNGN